LEDPFLFKTFIIIFPLIFFSIFCTSKASIFPPTRLRQKRINRAFPENRSRDLCKTPPFARFLCLPREMRSLFLWGQAQILILKILHVFLWLKFSPSLNLNPAKSGKHFSKVSSLLRLKQPAVPIPYDHDMLFSSLYCCINIVLDRKPCFRSKIQNPKFEIRNNDKNENAPMTKTL